MRKAEVGHECVPAAQQDVAGLDVAVHHALLAGVVERFGHLRTDGKRLFERQRALAPEPSREGFALDHRHHVEEQAVAVAAVVERDDAGVAEPRCHPDLADEALMTKRGGEFG